MTTAGEAHATPWLPVALGGFAASAAALVAIVAAVILVAAGARVSAPSFAVNDPSGTALADIPAAYLAFYRGDGERYGLDWAILAAIGKVETDHGRSRLPGVQSGVNCAGAAGPMQFGIGAGDHGCGDAGDGLAQNDCVEKGHRRPPLVVRLRPPRFSEGWADAP